MMPQVTMTPEQLQEILKAVVANVTRLNPLEQRKFDEEIAKERRRDMLAVQLGRAEAEAQRNKRNNCSHMRFPASHRMAGHGCPKDTPGGEWTTGGQAYQNGLAMLFCQRCNSEWWFQPTQDYYSYIMQNGISGIAPPPDDQTYCIGCYNPKPKCNCSEISREHVAAHPTVAV